MRLAWLSTTGKCNWPFAAGFCQVPRQPPPNKPMNPTRLPNRLALLVACREEVASHRHTHSAPRDLSCF